MKLRGGELQGISRRRSVGDRRTFIHKVDTALSIFLSRTPNSSKVDKHGKPTNSGAVIAFILRGSRSEGVEVAHRSRASDTRT
jgi:hypothetical protein